MNNLMIVKYLYSQNLPYNKYFTTESRPARFIASNCNLMLCHQLECVKHNVYGKIVLKVIKCKWPFIAMKASC